MEVQVEAGRIGEQADFVECVLAPQREAAVVGAGIRFEQRGGFRFGHAVDEDLHRMQAQVVALVLAPPRDEALDLFARIAARVRVEARAHVRLQLAGTLRGGIGLELGLLDARVEPAGDSVAVRHRMRFRERLRIAGRTQLRNDRTDAVERRFVHDAVRRARRIALVHAAGRIGRIGRNAGRFQPLRIETAAVHVEADHEQRPVGHDPVEQFAARICAERGEVRAAEINPRLVRRRVGARADALQDRIRVVDPGQIEVAENLMTFERVHVAVDQARQHQPAGQIDHARRGAGERADVVVATDGDDLAVLRGERLREAALCVAGVEQAVQIDGVGMLHVSPPDRGIDGRTRPADGPSGASGRVVPVGLEWNEMKGVMPACGAVRDAGFADRCASPRRRGTHARPRGRASVRGLAWRVSVASDAPLSSGESDTRSGPAGCLSSF